MKNEIETGLIKTLGGFTLGQKVEVWLVLSKKWRAAHIVSFTSGGMTGEGCYIFWDDVKTDDTLKPQGGWRPLCDVRVSSAKPVFQVGAYVPAGESQAVLVPMARNHLGISFVLGGVVRRSEVSAYQTLLDLCDHRPVWLYNQAPVEL